MGLLASVARGTRRRTLVMGIVNLTPDSFSDGGMFASVQHAVEHALRLLAEGADLIDLGAESTRPGASPVAADVEWRRLEPVLTLLRAATDARISVDTYKAAVAQQALAAGADMINDVWGGLADPDMLRTVANAGASYVWMHNRRHPVQPPVAATVLDETRVGIRNCLQAGIRTDRLWIDPGIGFAKDAAANLTLLAQLDQYCALGFPVLLGVSRKSVIGHVNGAQVSDRVDASTALAALATWHGVSCVRVHDVRQTVAACSIVEAVRDAKP